MKRRLFVAIDFPHEIKVKLETLIEELSLHYQKLKWVKKDNFHLTLKFLGWVEEKKVEVIMDKLNQAVENISSFDLQLTQLGYFLNYKTIIWLGIKKSDELFSLVRNIDKEMTILGFISEKKPFLPHITLGRGKMMEKEKLEKLKRMRITEKINFSSYKVIVDSVDLMESRLKSNGVEYQSLAKFAFRS